VEGRSHRDRRVTLTNRRRVHCWQELTDYSRRQMADTEQGARQWLPVLRR